LTSEIHYFSPEENYNQNEHDQLQSLPTKDFTSSAATPHYGGTPKYDGAPHIGIHT